MAEPYYADLSKEFEVLEMLGSINPDVVINLVARPTLIIVKNILRMRIYLMSRLSKI